jgi:hypothetical protein
VLLDSWPGQMRTVFDDHQRFVDTYFTGRRRRAHQGASAPVATAAMRIVRACNYSVNSDEGGRDGRSSSSTFNRERDSHAAADA